MVRFNAPKVKFMQENKKKAREAKKRAGVPEKAKQERLKVSGTRTKKHQRKMAHRQRMLEKDSKAAALGLADMEMKDAKGSKPKKSQKKARASGGADAMQD